MNPTPTLYVKHPDGTYSRYGEPVTLPRGEAAPCGNLPRDHDLFHQPCPDCLARFDEVHAGSDRLVKAFDEAWAERELLLAAAQKHLHAAQMVVVLEYSPDFDSDENESLRQRAEAFRASVKALATALRAGEGNNDG